MPTIQQIMKALSEALPHMKFFWVYVPTNRYCGSPWFDYLAFTTDDKPLEHNLIYHNDNSL